jgi:hypothetical protein
MQIDRDCSRSVRKSFAMLDAIPARSHERMAEQDECPHGDRQPNDK